MTDMTGWARWRLIAEIENLTADLAHANEVADLNKRHYGEAVAYAELLEAKLNAAREAAVRRDGDHSSCTHDRTAETEWGADAMVKLDPERYFKGKGD